jgi:hypothetical protein
MLLSGGCRDIRTCWPAAVRTSPLRHKQSSEQARPRRCERLLRGDPLQHDVIATQSTRASRRRLPPTPSTDAWRDRHQQFDGARSLLRSSLADVVRDTCICDSRPKVAAQSADCSICDGRRASPLGTEPVISAGPRAVAGLPLVQSPGQVAAPAGVSLEAAIGLRDSRSGIAAVSPAESRRPLFRIVLAAERGRG